MASTMGLSCCCECQAHSDRWASQTTLSTRGADLSWPDSLPRRLDLRCAWTTRGCESGAPGRSDRGSHGPGQEAGSRWSASHGSLGRQGHATAAAGPGIPAMGRQGRAGELCPAGAARAHSGFPSAPASAAEPHERRRRSSATACLLERIPPCPIRLDRSILGWRARTQYGSLVKLGVDRG